MNKNKKVNKLLGEQANWGIFTLKNVPRWVVFSVDLVIVIHTFFLAHLIEAHFSVDFLFSEFANLLPSTVFLASLSFWLTGSYKGMVRYTGFNDAVNVLLGATFLLIFMLLTAFANGYFGWNLAVSNSVFVLVTHYLLNILVLVFSRFTFKYLHRILRDSVIKNLPVLIYGAGEMGVVIHTSIRKEVKSKYRVVGFVDDDEKKIGKKINRLPILAPSKITPAFLKKKGIREVIIALRGLSSERLGLIFDTLNATGVEIKIAPPISEWIQGDLNLHQIKKIQIEDLLDRTPIDLKHTSLPKQMNGKTVLVTGAAGSIGSELSRQLHLCNCQRLLLVDQSESALFNLEQEFKRQDKCAYQVFVADIRDAASMDVLFSTHRPDLVFHAAAYKHVPMMEETPYEAVKTNVMGTKILADLSLKYAVDKFVMVSTDKAVNPTNIMGATKRVSEMYVSSLQVESKGVTKFITTRFGNVLGSSGSVIPLFKKQIDSGGPLTLTHRDITRYFMTIPEASQLVLEASVMGNGGDLFVFDMGQSVKIFDLAVRMIELSGLRYPADIDIKISGLRPGEKLHEELLNTTERTLPTHHPKITIAQTAHLDAKKTVELVEALCVQNQVKTPEDTVKRLKEIVPEFVSQNSVYVSLDAPAEEVLSLKTVNGVQ